VSAIGSEFCWIDILLFVQDGIEHMREPYACFLQLLSDNRRVHHDIGSIDRHFPRWLVTGRALSRAVLRLRLLCEGEGLILPSPSAPNGSNSQFWPA
jgi:hypothetical protein